jgi:hypothetical protein
MKANTTRACLCIVGVMALLLPAPADAQLCVGSHLAYVVRNAQGSPVSAESTAFTFMGSVGSSSWYPGDKSFFSFAAKLRSDTLLALKDTITPLTTSSAYCNFTKPVDLKVTMSGKTMELTFLMPALHESYSRSFLVDGLPFQEGRFEITLAITGQDHSFFYPANGWTKK